MIQNLILSSESLKHTESWIPICLPGISDSGYLQIYINFIEEDIGIVYITESQEHSYFLQFSEQSRNINELFEKDNLVNIIKHYISYKDTAVRKKEEEISKFSADELFTEFCSRMSKVEKNEAKDQSRKESLEEAKYLLCKNKSSNQLFSYKFNNFENTTDEERKIIYKYSELYDILNSKEVHLNENNFFHCGKCEKYTHVILTNDHYILFASFRMFKDFDEVHFICSDIMKVIKQNEANFYINKS